MTLSIIHDPLMNAPRTLCLNMIVKNEMANLERCLGAVAGHIGCWVIGDTGSTDGTQDFIRAFFAERGLPGELHEFPFVNFEQARNEALDRAYASTLGYDYLLFDDADMELVVEDPDFRTKLEAPGYQLVQRAGGGLVYWNTRLARRDVGARYHGVTHEYLDVPGGTQRLQRVWYKDHASGANRVDKFERDARLLTEALRQDPDNHRYWYYLAQSYRDAGRTKEAAEAYAKRAGMGGWDEEAWNARLEEARCLRTLGDKGGFLRAALAAFNQRPHRAEPLYDLARYYRERGMHDASVLFSEPGLALPRPEQDSLFIEDFVYTAGLREEFSIAANYSRDPARKDRGHAVCDWLALSREVPWKSRDLARSNLFFYVEPARALMPSFSARPVGFAPPEGWKAINPSVARWGEQIVMVQRCVNYTLTEDGEYKTPAGSPVATRNFLLRLSAGLGIESSVEILPPADLPAPAFDLVLGFEDARLFTWRGELWCSSNVRQLTPEGWCEQVLARIDCPPTGPCRLTDWRVLRPEGPRLHEKNWMPLVAGDELRFIYSCDPTRVVNEQARTVTGTVPSIGAEQFRGGSQAIEFEDGWLALVHEASERDQKRYYWHRFVWFDAENVLRRASRRFFFQTKGIEFAVGMAWHRDGRRLLISYGVTDTEAWIATVEAGEVRAILRDAGALMASGPSEGSTALHAPTAESTVPRGQTEAALKTCPERAETEKRAPSSEIPRIFHFIYFGKPDDPSASMPFLFVHYMAIHSALQVNKDFTARLYYNCEPGGPYWDLAKREVELVHVDALSEVFGRPVELLAHKTDVLKLQILLENGGIYLDLDTICQRSFDPLLDGRVVLGNEERMANGRREPVGLCKAIIITPPRAELLRLWYESYREFVGGRSGDLWNRFSVQIPMELTRKYPELVRIEPAASFFWPSWDSAGIRSMFAEDLEFPEAFSFHLWQAKSARYLETLDAKAVLEVDTTYNKVARRFVSTNFETALQASQDLDLQIGIPLDPPDRQPAGSGSPVELVGEDKRPSHHQSVVESKLTTPLLAHPQLPMIAAGSPFLFNICDVTYYQHNAVYYDMMRCLHGSLNDLGHECSITTNALKPGAVNLVLGNIVLPSQEPARVEFLRAGPFILYQLEQLRVLNSEPTLKPGYFSLLDTAAHILEFSPSGLDFLHSTAWASKTSFLPPSFHRSLEFFRPARKQDIDVLFYGSHSDRRNRIIEELRSKGLHAAHLFGVYDETLFDHIRRSKIILNIHFRPHVNNLETVRISPLLANRCFVISEASDHNPYGNGVIFAEHDQIGETCLTYLRTNADKREAVAMEGYLTLRRSDMVSDLGQIIERLRLDDLVYQP